MLTDYGNRVMAFATDIIVSLLITLLVVMFTVSLGASWDLSDSLEARGLLTVCFILYRSIGDAYFEGTVGRWLAGYRLLSETGEPPRLGILVLRNLILTIPLVYLFFVISWERRTVLDRLFNTYAVKIEQAPNNKVGRFLHTRRDILYPVAEGLVIALFILMIALNLA